MEGNPRRLAREDLLPGAAIFRSGTDQMESVTTYTCILENA